MELFKKILFSLIFVVGFSQLGNAQFQSWVGQSFEEEATDAHSIYRQALKAQDWEVAFENWQKAYDFAPVADGKRDYHFIDGVKLYVHKFQKETDPEKKKEYIAMINKLYDEAVQAYETKAIKPSACGDNDDCYKKKIGYVYNRKGYDMFYSLRAKYSENLAVYDKALEMAGNDIEYTIFDPLSAIVVYQFQKGKLTKEEAVEYHQKMSDIAAYNLENNKTLGAYYDQAWKAAVVKFGPIETEIFDCDYFKPKYKQMYDDDPNDMDQLKNLVALLKKRNCDPNDPLLVDLDTKWKAYAAKVNAERQAEFEANNPSFLAKKAYDAGDFDGAVEKYDEAIEQETDVDKKASYLFSKASIQFRKLKQYSKARATAYEAAKAKPNYGRPYMLIGDMYGASARNCGDDWNQRLAIIAAIDKYRYAKSIDAEVAEEANQRISKYNASLPDKTEGHMRSVKKGDKQKVGCWIGETVSVRFK
ncbi:MAG: tetratricopeptide repeat protein [Saprospiraceae bacterium]|nr:hypothetical protein [Bacteroidia bacterium]NNL91740.1 tetratricopeptide repeat protein [Saprospiraceae bacterium]